MTKEKYRIDRGVQISIQDIEPNPWNPNKTTDRQQEAIAESLGNYGQIVELLVRSHPDNEGKYQVIDGEHRLGELAKAGGQVYANIIYDIPDAEAKKLTIILNETRGSADRTELSNLLAGINNELGSDLTLIGLPYSETELDELIKLSEAGWDDFTESENDNNNSNSGKWETIMIKVPSEAMERIRDAYNLIEEERNGLNNNEAIAWGQVLESLAADYLAGA